MDTALDETQDKSIWLAFTIKNLRS